MMVATIGPASYNFSETMSTLRYADSAKKIKNKPKINGMSNAKCRRRIAFGNLNLFPYNTTTEDPKDTQLRNYQQQIAELKAMLEAKVERSGRKPGGKKRFKKLDSKTIFFFPFRVSGFVGRRSAWKTSKKREKEKNKDHGLRCSR